ncbi:cilia- and flagella-associated protein 337-like isoform X2 [Dysidea avara]|uniref:cilia- and flagella-associated protein 337-like isoform X2 n=1 Tax=Dysidea avara TaxID=196820 RepID=UPI003334434A
MDSVRTSPEQLASSTISSHSLKNIAKEVLPLLTVPKIDLPDGDQPGQASPTNQPIPSRGVANSAMHVEDKMSLEQFEQLKDRFYQGSSDEDGYLTKEEFKFAISELLGVRDQDHVLSLLFVKIDTTCDGLIDWNQFCSYLLMQFQDKDRLVYGRPVPFQSQVKLRHNMYNKETICRIMYATNPPRYITVSKDGAVCVWSSSMQLQRGCNITVQQTTSPQHSRASGSGALWVTDCILMNNCNKLVVATTSNELLFLDLSTTLCHCQHRLSELSHIPLCLDYYYEPQQPGGSSYLLCGDESGNVTILHFPTPTIRLFTGVDTSSRPARITLQNVMEGRSPKCQIIPCIHDDWVQQIQYIPHNHSFISCSASSNNSLVISDIEQKKKPYVFNLRKGVSCFDFSHKMDILVTGSMDHLLHMWNPYVPGRSIATMAGHSSTIIAVLIDDQDNAIFSFSQDGVLMCWDLNEHTLLQYITVRFPFTQRLPDYGPRPLYHSPSSIIVMCNEHIAEYQLGITDHGHSQNRWTVTTQKYPLCAALYSVSFHQVVVGGEGSEVNVWDIDSGEMVVQFGDCHGNNEITAMTIDNSGRRLVTGSRKGDIKVWNFLSGECQKTLMASSKEANEVTGLIHLVDKKKILSVGWDKRITTFPDVADVLTVYPDEFWQCEGGQTHHKDDILCVAYCRPNYLATGSFDGQIIVWNVDSEKIIAKYRTRTASKLDTMQLTRTESIVTSSSRCSTRQSRSSRPTSRRHFYHRVKSASLKTRHVPVDQLVFLKSRLQSRLIMGTGVLVSSEHGDACCYELTGRETPSGTFRITQFDEENVWALTTDHTNNLLVAGDTAGFVSVFDITSWCRNNSTRLEEVSSWHAHVAEVVSIECIPHEYSTLVLTASADCTARLWTINGNYIGTFGQEQRWSISDPSTHQHPLTPWGVMRRPSSGLLDNGGHAHLASVKEGETDQSEQPMTNKGEESVSSSSIDHTSNVSITMPTQQQPWSKGMSILLGCKPTLGQPYNKTIQQRMKGKKERREQYADIDLKRTQRFGNLCSAFQALQMPVICDVDENDTTLLPAAASQRR